MTEIKSAHININASTKKQRGELPVFSDCELSIWIGEFGFAVIDVRQKPGEGSQRGDFGRIATLNIHKPDEMERIANALLAIASAARIVNKDD